MSTPAIELELDYLVWEDKNGNEQTTPAHTLPSGTKQIFVQSSAPVGWTKDSTHNNKALRVVNSMGGGTGGNMAFTSAMASRSWSTGSFTMNSTTYMPSHRHYTTARHNKNNSDGSSANAYSANRYTAKYQYTNYEGGNGAHSHSSALDLRVQYVDVLICSKD